MSSSPNNNSNKNINIKLHLTGFGPFLNVKDNPSSTIMKLVADYYRSSRSFSGDDDEEPTKNSINNNTIITVVSTDELEVSVQAVQKYIEEEKEKLSHHHRATSEKNEDTTGPSVIDIFIHFGVNRSSKRTIAIENEAVNCVLIPPNDHSGFKRTYCARISGDNENNGENQKSDRKISSVEVEEDKTFTADSVSDEKPPPTSSSLSEQQQQQPLLTTLIPSTIKKLTEEICSTVLNRPFKNISKTKTRKVNVENNNNTNSSSDDIDSSSFQPPEEFCIAPSLDAGKYLCNFIFYLSCLKLSSRQNKASGCRVAGFSHPGFSEMFRGLASYLSSGDASHNNDDEEKKEKKKGTDDDSETENSNSDRHSFFIHVLDPCRVVEEDQAQAICMFLDELFARL